jgi:hypothetical protein
LPGAINEEALRLEGMLSRLGDSTSIIPELGIDREQAYSDITGATAGTSGARLARERLC